MKFQGPMTLDQIAVSINDLSDSFGHLANTVDERFANLETELHGFKADMYVELSQKADKFDVAAVREEIEAFREDNQRFISDIHDGLSKRISKVERAVTTRRPKRS